MRKTLLLYSLHYELILIRLTIESQEALNRFICLLSMKHLNSAYSQITKDRAQNYRVLRLVLKSLSLYQAFCKPKRSHFATHSSHTITSLVSSSLKTGMAELHNWLVAQYCETIEVKLVCYYIPTEKPKSRASAVIPEDSVLDHLWGHGWALLSCPTLRRNECTVDFLVFNDCLTMVSLRCKLWNSKNSKTTYTNNIIMNKVLLNISLDTVTETK